MLSSNSPVSFAVINPYCVVLTKEMGSNQNQLLVMTGEIIASRSGGIGLLRAHLINTESSHTPGKLLEELLHILETFNLVIYAVACISVVGITIGLVLCYRHHRAMVRKKAEAPPFGHYYSLWYLHNRFAAATTSRQEGCTPGLEAGTPSGEWSETSLWNHPLFSDSRREGECEGWPSMTLRENLSAHPII